MSHRRTGNRIARAVAVAALATSAAWATAATPNAPEVQAVAQPSRVTPGDRFQYTVEITHATRGMSEPQLPDLERAGFRVLGGPSVSQSFKSINLQMTSTVTYRWVLQAPAREGGFTIGPARVATGGGRTLQSNSVQVTVSKAPAVPALADFDDEEIYSARSRHPQLNERLRGKLFVRATVDKSEAYVGEQVTLRYDLYQATDARLPRYTINPGSGEYPGFMATVLDKASRLNFRLQRVGNRQFRVAPIETIALFPIKTGPTTIPMRLMAAEISVGGSRSPLDDFFPHDPFPSLFDERVRADLKARSIVVNVLPPPAEGRPPDFSKTVGDYEMTAAFDSETVKQHDLVTLKVEFRGTGHVDAVFPPELPEVPGLELYREQSNTETRKAGQTVGGTKTFEFLLRPTEAGDIEMPPIEYVVFNPADEAYERLRTKTLALHVTPAERTETPIVTVAPETNGSGDQEPSPVVSINRDIEYIRTTGFLRHGLGAVPLYRHPGFLLFQLIPIGLVGVSVAVRRRREKLEGDVALARRRAARGVAARRLRDARKLLAAGRADAFFEELDRALRQFAADQVNESAAGLTAEALGRSLEDRGAQVDDVAEVLGLMELCESVRYSNSRPGATEMNRVFERASQVINRLARSLR